MMGAGSEHHSHISAGGEGWKEDGGKALSSYGLASLLLVSCGQEVGCMALPSCKGVPGGVEEDILQNPCLSQSGDVPFVDMTVGHCFLDKA